MQTPCAACTRRARTSRTSCAARTTSLPALRWRRVHRVSVAGRRTIPEGGGPGSGARSSVGTSPSRSQHLRGLGSRPRASGLGPRARRIDSVVSSGYPSSPSTVSAHGCRTFAREDREYTVGSETVGAHLVAVGRPHSMGARVSPPSTIAVPSAVTPVTTAARASRRVARVVPSANAGASATGVACEDLGCVYPGPERGISGDDAEVARLCLVVARANAGSPRVAGDAAAHARGWEAIDAGREGRKRC
jgi:hypothetical protein